MNVEILPELSTAQLQMMDSYLLDESGKMYVWPSDVFAALNPESLRVWCCLRARYGLVTLELLAWLQDQIAGRTALEIGAGMGDLGHRLQIKMTDDYQQVTNPTTIDYIRITRQIPTDPPRDVIKMDAQTAVLKFKPRVVIGSWITQRHLPGDDHGNMFGPREEIILDNCQTYIHIGNERIHSDKRILKRPHSAYRFPWLHSRAIDQSQNVIYVWNAR